VLPHDPRGQWPWQTCDCTMSENSHVNFSFSYINTCINSFPHCGPPDHGGGGHGFNKLAFVLCLKASLKNSAFLAQWFLRRFLYDPNSFLIFLITSPLRRIWSFIWTNLNSLYSRIICTKFDWIWPLFLEKKILIYFFSVFLIFCYYLPLEKGVPLRLNKIKSPPPTPQDDLCQVWLKLA
jgi:hypothetical protein